MPSAHAHKLTLSLQFADIRHRDVLPRHKILRWIKNSLDGPAELTLRIVGLEEARLLNRDFRGKDYATNVLTFNYTTEPIILADLVICAPVVEHEALQANLPLQAHYVHMIVHGVLHAQGWDHIEPAEATAMEAKESFIIQALGFPDPYAPSRQPA